MRLAQKLYEGIELGKEGSVGLITYMRTDSVRVAKEAIDEARSFIKEEYGENFLPSKARFLKAEAAHKTPMKRYVLPRLIIRRSRSNNFFQKMNLVYISSSGTDLSLHK